MTVEEARKRYEQYKEEIHWQNNHEHEDALFEVTEYLLNQTKDSWYSSDLGSYYYDRRQFDLALKYYEMTYELGDHDIAVCLGYIWYYGRTGTVDYEKAFRYFSEAAALGNDEGKRKLADMYKNGYFVEPDYAKYCSIIEELYEAHKDDERRFLELPDRLKTVEHADQILVIDQGKIVQQGTHAELLSQEGIYRNFIQERREAAGWKIKEAV